MTTENESIQAESKPDLKLVRPGFEERRRLLSIVMPARNEEGNLRAAYVEVSAVMQSLDLDYEVIIIDNDSTDRTAELANELCQSDPRWRYLKFSRNFQVEASIAAGLRFAKGDAAVVLFSDLQDPPAVIPEFIRKWDEGYDVVYGVVRNRQGEPAWRTWGARLMYRVIDSMADIEITPDATDFRLLSRKAINAVNQFDERNRYLRGLTHWVGFKRCGVPYDRRPRLAGQSQAPLWVCANLAVNAITSFSIRPLRFFSLLGVVALIATVALTAAYLGSYLFAYAVPGLTTIYLLLLGNLTVMLFGFGTVGEYIGRIYMETKKRPLFLVDRAINLDLHMLDGFREAGLDREIGGLPSTASQAPSLR
jgi:dolichol-phosphate mannosyltransferase